MTFQAALSFFTLCGLCIICLTATTSEPKAKSGPYTVTIVGLKQCEKPNKPYQKDPALKVFMENTFKKKGVLKGNITVLKDTKNIKTTVKEYYYEDGKWQITFNVNNLSCHSRLIRVLMDAMDVKYDKKTCAYPKGAHNFNVNYNFMDHLWMTTRDYGRMLRRMESYDKTGTILCHEIETIVGPQKQ